MIIDSRIQAFQTDTVFDTCIIGAGPAGITLALELAKSGKAAPVALLETGGFSKVTAAQARFAGEVSIGSDKHPSLHRVRHAGVGGSSELWSGWCRPLDPMDFQPRNEMADSGWPFDADELHEYYQQANHWCGLGPRSYEPQQWAGVFKGNSLAQGDLLADALYRLRPLQFGCHYRQALEQSQAITLFTQATALKLQVSHNPALINSVHVHWGNGSVKTLRAKRFVLAAGGLENARLLLLSGESPERSIGNQHDRVGRYYTEHGFVNSGWFRTLENKRQLKRYFSTPHPDGEIFGMARHVLTLRSSIFRKQCLNNAALYFHPTYEANRIFDDPAVQAALELWEVQKGQAVRADLTALWRIAVSAPHRVVHALLRKLLVRQTATSAWRLRCYFECSPNAQNRVQLCEQRDDLGRPRLRLYWSWGEQDLTSVWCFHKIIDHQLRLHRLGRLQFSDDLSLWRERTETGKHLMGTTRMHNSSSIFPTGGYANPTLTIVALAVRLAKHLATKDW